MGNGANFAAPEYDGAGFEGAKVALFLGARLAVIQRDDLPGLSYAGYWDLPGGGREGAETPFDCVARECREELGLEIRCNDIFWSRRFHNAADPSQPVWFFVAHLSEVAASGIVFGDEGQGWAVMSVDQFLQHPKAVPAFQDRLRLYLESGGAVSQEKPPLP